MYETPESIRSSAEFHRSLARISSQSKARERYAAAAAVEERLTAEESVGGFVRSLQHGRSYDGPAGAAAWLAERAADELIEPGAVTLLEISATPAGPARVDVESCVVYGCKVVGLQSCNTGKVLGLPRAEFGNALDLPYSYGSRALETALPLYEGCAIRLNHPPTIIDDTGARRVRDHSRGAMDTVGELKNVRMKRDGLYGDLHLLKSHPSTPFVLEMAQRMPGKLALSHNAHGVPVLEGGRIAINRILKVVSVDLVGEQPGTTAGLFESAADETPGYVPFGGPDAQASQKPNAESDGDGFWEVVRKVVFDNTLTDGAKILLLKESFGVQSPTLESAAANNGVQGFVSRLNNPWIV